VTLISFDPRPLPTARAIPFDGITAHRVAEDAFRYTRLPAVAKWLSPRPLAYAPHCAMRDKVREVAGGERWDAFIAMGLPVAVYANGVDAPARVVDIDTALSFWSYEALARAEHPGSRLRRRVSWRKGRAAEANMLRDYDAASLASPVELDYVRNTLRGRHLDLRIVANGVDCDRNRPGLRPRAAASLVYNGALTYSANFDAAQWFLEAIYPRIRAGAPHARMTVTGALDGVNLAALRLDDSVTLTGYVEDARLPVAEATLCAVPLRRGGGTRLKILEAMALGTPVVSTRKGAEGLDVTDGENIALADDPAEFARRVLDLLNDEADRERLTRNARRLVEERYDWRQVAPRFRLLVEQTAARSRRAA
jgi:glycosyltransferase involved in cell wall biosynthesis